MGVVVAARNLASPVYDVLVIGGGHAGCEAASAAARMGAKVALLTHRLDSIGAMSCNPSIGGIGKGHLVREIDAFDGIMSRAADEAAIQFRTLNASRGLAVRGPRAQCDRRLYKAAVNDALRSSQHASLTLIEASAERFITDGNAVLGVRTNAQSGACAEIRAGAVVLTTGTFLNGKMFVGDCAEHGGRRGDVSSVGIAEALRGAGLKLGRMKTGTPPRIWANSIDFTGLHEERSEADPLYFSFLTNGGHSLHQRRMVSCYQVKTTKQTHDIVRAALAAGKNPQFICDNGPRYCPSLESKVLRFGDRDGHIVWLEPEGLDSDLVYPAGISMSLPAEIQRKIVNSIPAMERAEIAIPGYSVEYDYVDPRELRPNLECHQLPRLFLAGQINGTTGYEEAAAQGLVAGINATLRLSQFTIGDADREAHGCVRDGYLRLGRGDAYIGVLLDDLTRLGTMEPYRMLTSRAEFRLCLRPDNADARLTPVGAAVGCISRERWSAFKKKEDMVERSMQVLESVKLVPSQWKEKGFSELFCSGKTNGKQKMSLAEAASRTSISLKKVCQIFGPEWSVLSELIADGECLRHVEAQCKYRAHITRQTAQVERVRRDEQLALPAQLDYALVNGLSNEECEKLSAQRPKSLGEAGRISGVTPAGIVVLRSYVRRMATI